jgi:autotransporter-associated beta strand protein
MALRFPLSPSTDLLPSMKKSSLCKMVKLPRVMLLCAGALGAAGHSAFAANDLWIGNTDANFNTLANWTGSVSPNGNTPEFGVAGTSGTALTNDISNATYAAFLFDSGASAYTIGGNSFTLNGDITNNSTSAQVINNAITWSNAAHTFNAASGDITLGGGGSGTTRTLTFLGSGTTTLGGTNKFNLKGINFSGFVVGGVKDKNTGIATPGNLSVTGATTVDGTGFTDYRGYLDVHGNSNVTIQSGGSLTINTSTGAGLNSGIGNDAVGTSTMTINGGSFTINGNGGFILGNNRADATGVLTISSGTATITAGSTTLQDVRNMIAMGRDGATGILNLNGGTLATGRQFVRDGSAGGTAGTRTATFNFNGGTLQAQADQTQGNGWFETATTGNFQIVTTNVKEGGAIIDTNGFSVNINTALIHAGSNAIDGGLIKNGAGVLSLGGANTFTGMAQVNAGTLSLATNVSLDDTIVLSLAANTTLDLAFASGSERVFGLMLNGTAVADGTYTAAELNTLGAASSINFTSSGGTLTVGAVPEPGTVALLSMGLFFGLVALRRSRVSMVS